MRAAHRLGMSTTATMMWGHVETLEERMEHLRRIRDLQDEMHGFRAFISWTYQPDNTALAPQVTWNPTSFDYLLMQAITRIYLDNVEHIQSSWVTQGTKIGQVALGFGADDMGSIMIEENVVSAAGTTYRATTEDFVHYIRNAGFRPGSATRSTAPFASTRRREGHGLDNLRRVARGRAAVDRRPAQALRMLPDEIRNAEVLENGDIACELGTVGVHEPMTVRIVEQDPPRRLVEARVDGSVRARDLRDRARGRPWSRVTLTAEVELPMLASAIASGPVKSALGDQLRNLATLVATEG